MQKSSDSRVAHLMNLLSLDRVVYFTLRGGTAAQREELGELINANVVARLPIQSRRHPHWRRQIIVCRTRDGVSDIRHISDYRAVLQHVFGPKCRVAPRVVERAMAHPDLRDSGDEKGGLA